MTHDLGAADECLVGEIASAYAFGWVRGPVRLAFTDHRFVVVRTVRPGPAAGYGAYRSWRAAVAPGPVCQTVEPSAGCIVDVPLAAFPNAEVAAVRVQRGGGIWADKTLTGLIVSNARHGWQVEFGADRQAGVPEHSPKARPPLIFRVPATPDEVAELVRHTPLAGVLVGP
ncbi:MAG: hypothetical protein L3K17_01825 [Thermoplasmata archaeon]|nr:hypothetical protein [Thermoplasmata archaeon]